MKLEQDTIFKWVQMAAHSADKLVLISPFFTLRDDIRATLESIPRLQILIGDEFATNNPIPIERLSELDSIDVRCIYRSDLKRRLHAKVFFAVEQSGRCRALVGSANFTVSGLTKNEEQAISLDSRYEADRETLKQIELWVGKLESIASEIDWVKAKQEYESAPNPTFSYEDFCVYRQDQIQNYWILKTTEGSTGRSRWKEFVTESVLSIGWLDVVEIMAEQHGIEPNEYEIENLRDAAATWANRAKDSRRAIHAANMLHHFSRKFAIGDRVILCRGYGPNQNADVTLYGLAIVNSEAFDDRNSTWWRLKRHGVFWRKDLEIPKATFVDAFGRKSLLQTIHKISESEYEEFCRRIQDT